MSLYEVLTVITCLTSTITMIIVLIAVLPHFKNGLAIVRDAILWVTMVLILFVMCWIGWQRLTARDSATRTDSTPEARSPQATRPITVRQAK